MRSLKHRLVLWLTLATLSVWATTSLFLYNRTTHEVEEVFDAQLAQSARLLMAVVLASADRGELEHLRGTLSEIDPVTLPKPHSVVDLLDDHPGIYERLIAYQVFINGQGLRLSSGSAPEQALAEGTSGFSVTWAGGQRWRVFSLSDPERGLVLHAGERYEIREELAGYVVQSLAFPVVLAIPALILIVWLAVRPPLRPLMALGREVKRRDPTDLRPLPLQEVPLEVIPLVHSLNTLFGRLRRALEAERAFTGDAAHELRRPLAALRVQAQVAGRTTGEEERRRALGQIIFGVDHAAHLVDQLLTLSRLDAQHQPIQTEHVDLRGVAGQALRTLAALAEERRVHLDLAASEPVTVLGNAAYLEVLIRNLLDNAIRHSPEGGHVGISLERDGHGALVRVSDEGTGIPQERREDVFRRFHRLEGAPQKGTGLGLSIVRRIAELHEAEVTLADRTQGGLAVEVRFGPGARAAG